MGKGHWSWDVPLGEGRGMRTVWWRGPAGPSEELIHVCIREPASREVHVHQRHTEKNHYCVQLAKEMLALSFILLSVLTY